MLKKLGYATTLGLLLGILTGLGRVLFLFYSDSYSVPEFEGMLFNYLQVSLNHYAAIGLAGGLLFGVCSLMMPTLEGFIVAGTVVAFPLLPLLFYINKNLLPGRFHPISLVVNGVVLFTGAAITFLIYRYKFKNARFLSLLFNPWIALVACVLMLLINTAFSLQPTEKMLRPASVEAGELQTLFKENIVGKNDSATHTPTEELKRYFSRTRSRRLRSLPERLTLKDSTTIIADAERVVRREFTLLGVTRTLPELMDWRHNPTNDREWILALNRQDWLIELALAYHLTHDSRYARTFDKIMRSWLLQNPVLRWKDEGDNVWRLIETSARVTDSWIEAFGLFWESEEVGDDVKLGMLASFHDHAMFLAHFRSPRRNHLLQETFGLLAVAAAFPEFKMSEKWLEIAQARLDFAMKVDVYPDGGYNEGSTYYHRFAVRILQQIVDFAELYDVELSDFFRSQLEKMYDFLMQVAKPDGVMPQMNDGFHAKNLRPLFEKPARMFGRSDFEYFASDGSSGEPTSVTSTAYPYSGIYVMRSDWTPQARYMLIDAGPFGSSHGHEDKLNFELLSFGKAFIVESGTFTYVRNRWRKYFTSSFSHNTILVDGRSQMRLPFEGKWVNNSGEALPNKWISTDAVDFLEASYADAFGNIKEDMITGIKHTRRWLFVKPDYWLVWDVVAGAGEHELELLFHFAPEVSVSEAAAGEVHLSYDSGPSLYLKCIASSPVQTALIVGSETPIQGWVSPNYGEKFPAPVFSLKTHGPLPVSFVTLLFPEENKLTEFEFSTLPFALDGGEVSSDRAVAVQIRHTVGSDTVVIAPGLKGKKEIAGKIVQPQLSIIRTLDGEAIEVESWQVIH